MKTENALQDLYDYWVDSAQRSILFWDTMRRRGNYYLESLKGERSPVLKFGYETILDGRTLARPVNYSLVRVSEGAGQDNAGKSPGQRKRPIIIVDPRAGHGPGIGGSKDESEIGIALRNGHPVYFFTFSTEPEPGQTLADVETAETIFIEEVIKRHPDADRPALIGNCQGGWAAALISADRPDLAGLLVLNGSPLSYWSGVEGANPMRYTGGLCGGVWVNDLLSDLGNGKFDGAFLVQNFEYLNPANTYWSKLYNLYSKVDTERDRFLEFEKWWGGYYLMTADEIHYIVENLFIGDKLEKGELELRSGQCVNLKNIKCPIVVFASKGDNITPPQQALDWIPRVYSSDEEIVELGHVIIYIIHEKIGHLGIFVSGSVADKEHTEIIGNFDLIEFLPPGLWEMQIDEEAGKLGETDFEPRFERRTIAQMLEMVGGIETDCEGEECGDFRRVAELSRINDQMYRAFVQPWVRSCSGEMSGSLVRMLHPLRVKRYMCSDVNPLFQPLRQVAPEIEENRQPVSGGNPFKEMEKTVSEAAVNSLNLLRDIRDFYAETVFRAMYGSELMKTLLPKSEDEGKSPAVSCPVVKSVITPRDFEDGGFAAAVIRVIILVCRADGSFDRKEFGAARNYVDSYKEIRDLSPSALKQVIRKQVRLIQHDCALAVSSLAKLVPSKQKRANLYRTGVAIAKASKDLAESESEILQEIKKALGL